MCQPQRPRTGLATSHLASASRGAVRELRKDARFMARVQAKERQKEREELEGNYRRTFESLRFRG